MQRSLWKVGLAYNPNPFFLIWRKVGDLASLKSISSELKKYNKHQNLRE